MLRVLAVKTLSTSWVTFVSVYKLLSAAILLACFAPRAKSQPMVSTCDTVRIHGALVVLAHYSEKDSAFETFYGVVSDTTNLLSFVKYDFSPVPNLLVIHKRHFVRLRRAIDIDVMPTLNISDVILASDCEKTIQTKFLETVGKDDLLIGIQGYKVVEENRNDYLCSAFPITITGFVAEFESERAFEAGYLESQKRRLRFNLKHPVKWRSSTSSVLARKVKMLIPLTVIRNTDKWVFE